MAVMTEEFSIPYLREPAISKVYDNGYRFIYVPKRGAVFNVSTWVKTGSIHEDDSNNGVSHFLEHLMFKGTERFAPGEFDKAMESMGAVINAATWKDFTFYYITGPSGTQNHNFSKALDMHADMILFSTLPESEIGEVHDANDPNTTANKRERGVVIEEIGMRADQPWTKIYNAVNHMMYPEGHPYQRDVIGTRELIGAISRDAITHYYGTWYDPANLTTIVVGDFEPEWLEAAVLKSFDFRKPRPHKAPQQTVNYPKAVDTAGTRFMELNGDVQTSFFIIGFNGPDPTHLKESIAVDIASRVLGEGRSSRLYQALIERPKEPVFNMISCGQSTFKLGNVFFVQGNFNSPDAQMYLAQVKQELSNMLAQQPITADEFNRMKKKMKVDFAETSETASGIADSIGESITITGSVDGYTEYLNVLEAVTLEDTQAAAKKWFNPDKAYTAVMLPNEQATTLEETAVAA